MNVIIDTGPLFALFDKDDKYHYWAKKQITTLQDPLVTCEAVLTETLFLMQRSGINPDGLFELIAHNDLCVRAIFKNKTQKHIYAYIKTYTNLSCSFADAYLVQLYETLKNTTIFTIDSDFSNYRDSKDNPLSTISPY